MGLFDKKFCDICGEKIGLLGNRKLEDGNLCKDCAAKLSPWFSDRRKSTVADIKEQLEYREANKRSVSAFDTTKKYGEGFKVLFLDETKRKFAVCSGSGMNEKVNPDIVDIDKVTDCKFEIIENKDEIMDKDAEGKEISFNPPKFEYSYDFNITILVNHKYFDDMKFALTTSDVKRENDKFSQYVEMGNEIVKALTGKESNVQAPEIGEGAVIGSTTTQNGEDLAEIAINYENGDTKIPYQYRNKDMGLDLTMSLSVALDAVFEVTDVEKFNVIKPAIEGLAKNGLASAVAVAFQKLDLEQVSVFDLMSEENKLFAEIKKNVAPIELTSGISLKEAKFSKIAPQPSDLAILEKLGIAIPSEEDVEWVCPSCGRKTKGNFCSHCGTKKA